MEKTIYLDHAATTCVAPKVLESMYPYFCNLCANPSAAYSIGRREREAVEKSRKKVANILSTIPQSVIFTNGGTESDNLAIFGVARKHKNAGGHIISAVAEHHAVLHPLEQLETEGCEVTYLPVNNIGEVAVGDIKKAFRPDTILVSIMYANNEVGTIEPIEQIGKVIAAWRKERNTPYPFFHTDACQAANDLALNVDKLGVDLLTLNGSKIYGPKGIGILYKRRNVDIQPQILGGGQEFGLRGGTENVPSIIGMAEALEMVQSNRAEESKKIKSLRDYFWTLIQQNIDEVILNGPSMVSPNRLPNNLSVSFPNIDGRLLSLFLDKHEIICGTGSACASESLKPSHVLLACGISPEVANSTLRFTLGRENTKKEIEYTVKILQRGVKEMQKLKK